jgi:1,2-phenylacetyl-CoA epoxidase catalytic subunit
MFEVIYGALKHIKWTAILNRWFFTVNTMLQVYKNEILAERKWKISVISI